MDELEKEINEGLHSSLGVLFSGGPFLFTARDFFSDEERWLFFFFFYSEDFSQMKE